jgi:hypothetical protein
MDRQKKEISEVVIEFENPAWWPVKGRQKYITFLEQVWTLSRELYILSRNDLIQLSTSVAG